MASARPPTLPVFAPPSPGCLLGASALLVAAVALAYANSLGAPFLFDDQSAIVRNASIRSFRTALFPPLEASGATGRPLVNLSLAFNYALGGLHVRGYHLFNLALHAASALLLFGWLRRTFNLPLLRGRFGPAAWPLAWAVALLWALHPLQTESVTFVTQRTELLFAFLLLLAGYAFVRAVPADGGAPVARDWGCLAVLACLAGMGAKEVMVTAPVLLLLFDRSFVAGSFREAWRRRWRWHLGFAATWFALAGLLAQAPQRNANVGFGLGVGAWEYLLTQAHALILYLRLTVWPQPLVLDYGDGVVAGLAAVWPQGLAVVALLALTGWALARRPAAGFLGAWCFVILAPSSSFVPLTTQTIAEHRMYLPLAGLLTLAATVAWRARPRVVGSVLLGLAVLAGGLTHRRNADYRDAVTIWGHTAAHAPANHRAHYNLANALVAAGRPAEALPHYLRSLELQPTQGTVEHNLGAVLLRLGRPADAAVHLAAAVRLGPDGADVRVNLATAWVQAGRPAEAVGHYRRALDFEPGAADVRANLAYALLAAGRPEAAAAEARRALALAPANALAREVLARSGGR